MARAINIEILRLKRTKKTALLMIICALILALLVIYTPSTQAQYASAEKDRHVFVFNEVDSVGITVTENQWWIENRKEGLKYVPGTTKLTEPLITNTAGDCYMRAIIRITDAEGKPLNPEDNDNRLNLIKGTIWSDPDGRDIALESVYSRDDLQRMQSAGKIHAVCDDGFFDDPVWNPTMKAYTMDYKANNGIFIAGNSVKLFNRIVVPKDLSNEENYLMDEYYVVVWAQAIQKGTFSNYKEALSKLSNDYVQTQLPNDADGSE